MSIATTHSNVSDFPSVNINTFITIVVSGAFAILAFDLFGQTISPLMKGIIPTLGAKLAPVALANQSLGVITGLGAKVVSQYGIGHMMHLITGLFIYPIGYMFIARPISLKVLPALPWWVVGTVYGVVLWVFALYIMAHLVAGNPPFLGWSGITWVALWGHIVFGVVVAAFTKFRHEA